MAPLRTNLPFGSGLSTDDDAPDHPASGGSSRVDVAVIPVRAGCGEDDLVVAPASSVGLLVNPGGGFEVHIMRHGRGGPGPRHRSTHGDRIDGRIRRVFRLLRKKLFPTVMPMLARCWSGNERRGIEREG